MYRAGAPPRFHYYTAKKKHYVLIQGIYRVYFALTQPDVQVQPRRLYLLLLQDPEVARGSEEHHLLQVGEAELVVDLRAHLYRVNLCASRVM